MFDSELYEGFTIKYRNEVERAFYKQLIDNHLGNFSSISPEKTSDQLIDFKKEKQRIETEKRERDFRKISALADHLFP